MRRTLLTLSSLLALLWLLPGPSIAQEEQENGDSEPSGPANTLEGTWEVDPEWLAESALPEDLPDCMRHLTRQMTGTGKITFDASDKTIVATGLPGLPHLVRARYSWTTWATLRFGRDKVHTTTLDVDFDADEGSEPVEWEVRIQSGPDGNDLGMRLSYDGLPVEYLPLLPVAEPEPGEFDEARLAEYMLGNWDTDVAAMIEREPELRDDEQFRQMFSELTFRITQTHLYAIAQGEEMESTEYTVERREGRVLHLDIGDADETLTIEFVDRDRILMTPVRSPYPIILRRAAE